MTHTLVDLSCLTSFGVFGFDFFHYSFCNLFFHRVTITPTHLYPHLHYRLHYSFTIMPMIAVHIILDGYVRDYKTSTHNLVVEGSDNEVLSCIETFIDCIDTYRLLHTYLTYVLTYVPNIRTNIRTTRSVSRDVINTRIKLGFLKKRGVK